MIRCREIRKRFGTVEVLRGIDLDIARGEVVTVVGPSGAGKTTLLQIIGTLAQPDSGTVEIAGRDTGSLRPAELVRLRNEQIGFVFQFHHLLPEFTATENVMIPALIRRTSRAAAQRRAVELLELLGVGHRAGHKPAELSGGEQQRVAVARALVNDPSIILADEPTGNLDTKTSIDIMHLFERIYREGNTVIVVTHEEDIARHARRIVRLRDGRIESDEYNPNPTLQAGALSESV